VDVWNIIEALQREEKMTVFLTTHYMEEAAQANQIIILDHGRIITSGTPFELKEAYATDKLRLYSCKGNVGQLEDKVKELLKRQMDEKAEDARRQQMTEKIIREWKVKRLDTDGIEVDLSATLSAIPILNGLRSDIDGFEVIQGNMDDVFLNAVSTS